MSELPTPDRRSGSGARCRQHGVTAEYFLPQLQRLLRGAPRDRKVYQSLVDDVVGSMNPLQLFQVSQQRLGIYFIEALYRTHREQAEGGDESILLSLAPLGYSRWVAWRRFGDAVRDRSVLFDRRVDTYIARSRETVGDHLRDGWRPVILPDDPEFRALLGR